MKKYLLSLALLLSCTMLMAQREKSNCWIGRASYVYSFFYGKHNDKLMSPHRSVGGVSLELGARQYLTQGRGLFMEETAELYHLDLPVGKKGIEHTDGYWAWAAERLRETGLGAVLSIGYDFNINDKMQIGLYGGVNYRRILRFAEKESDGRITMSYSTLNKNNLRIRFGAELNVNRFNININVSPDVFNRTRGDWIGAAPPVYKNLQMAVGVGYFF